MGAAGRGSSLIFGSKTPDVDTPTSNGGNGGPANDNPGGGNKVPENNGSSNPDTRGNGDTPNAANDSDGTPESNNDNGTDTTTIPNQTKATGKLGDRPGGERTTNRPNASAQEKRGIELENESADTLANQGFKVEQNPDLTPDQRATNGVRALAEPDFLIEGRVFDAFAPIGNKLTSVIGGISSKIAGRQTQRVVVNLKDSPDVSIRDIQNSLETNPIPNLREVIVIDKNGVVHRTFPKR